MNRPFLAQQQTCHLLDPALSTLTRDVETPLYRQIYERLKQAIVSGTLSAGTRLPSSRALAGQLSAARGTVKAAYDLLSGEGYIICRGSAGTTVAVTHEPPVAGIAPLRPGRVRSSARGPECSPPLTLAMGVPALDRYPRKLWSTLVSREVRRLTLDPNRGCDGSGDPLLKQEIVNHLYVARGLQCRTEQIFITAGYQGAVALVARALLADGDQVWLEDPGYGRARSALELIGARIAPVPVDAEGLNVSAGVTQFGHARMAVVTPACHAPLGMTLSLPRRLQLLAWAAQAGAMILEDDYYGDLWHGNRPTPPLKALDSGDRVFYAGSFSKTMLARLRIGFLMVPETQIERFATYAEYLNPGAALVAQTALARFMASGHYARHVARMRRLYADRRAAFAAALEQQFEHRLKIDAHAAGMHLVARLDPGADDVALSARARAAGYGIEPLSRWYMRRPAEPGLIMNCANLPVDDALGEAQRLRRVIGNAATLYDRRMTADATTAASPQRW